MAYIFKPSVKNLPNTSYEVSVASLNSVLGVNSLFIVEAAEFCIFATTPTVKINIR
jgi:hypothetical protein